jgi:hypothetical protein
MRTGLIAVGLLLAAQAALAQTAATASAPAAVRPAPQNATPQEALARMPVREATIFKDGHAFMLHQGVMPTDGAGNVVLDYLPTPVLGTFWPFAADKQASLQAVLAGQRKVLIARTALNIRDLIEANVGAAVVITEAPAGREDKPLAYPATIVAVPVQSGVELEAASPPGAGPRLPAKGNVVVLKTAEGLKVVDFAHIQDVTFRGDIAQPKLASEEFRNLLTLKLDWSGKAPQATADVGLLSLQRGQRWIPQYKLNIDCKGSATVKFQATLVNEMVDLEDVTCNLVIGVPTFAFQDMTDPIALQQVLAQVARNGQDGYMGGQMLSNSMMSQVAGSGGGGYPVRPAAPAITDLGPEVAGGVQNEDLFVFPVKHVTLKKGQRLVLPVADYTLPYEDVYTLDLPFSPPQDIRANINTEQQLQIARLLSAPKVMHKLRLTNNSKDPLTTAPVLIFRDNKPMAQGLMTYTSVGGKVDLEITAAVDIKAKRTDKETARTPNAVNWQGDQYGKVELAGTISLTNYRKEPVKVEVTRSVLGNVDKDKADNDGKVEMLNVLDQEGFVQPFWWRWYGWPNWWYHFNGMAKITWNVSLESGKSIDLGYSWNYYWR